jgi:hypothetical protein
VTSAARARQRIRIPRISVRFVAEGVEALGHLQNVSRAGLFVRATDLPRPGVVVAMQFRSPVGSLVDLRGEVRWTTAGHQARELEPGFGVLLQEPPREYREFFLWALAQGKEE